MHAPTQDNYPVTIHQLQTGVDWITVTCRTGDPQAQKFKDATWHAMQVQAHIQRDSIKPYRFRGYEGMRVEGLAWGKRPDSYLAIASGPTATQYWKLFMRHATNITRLDLQVTCALERPMIDLTQFYWSYLKNLPKTRKITLLQNNGSGTTLYVGSRTSDQFGRIYDKGIESGKTPGPGEIWRYEVEYKAERAKHTCNELFLRSCRRKPLSANIAKTVYNWYSAREILPIFGEPPDGDCIALQLKAEETTYERKLNWLRTQVRPTVQSLIPHNRTNVLLALGLGDLLSDCQESEIVV